MKPRHFHLLVSIFLAAIAVGMAIESHLAVSFFFALGSLVALTHWKSGKSGITES